MSSSLLIASGGEKEHARRRAGGITRTVSAGFAHHQNGRLGRAEALYRKALERDPDHAEALHLLGVVAYQRGEIASAIALIGRALPDLRHLPEAHLNFGNALRESGRIVEAIESYQRAITLDPDYGMAHNNLARALNEQGLFGPALESSRRAITLIPSFVGAQLNCAAALLHLERFSEAEAPLREALDLMPDRAEIHRDLAWVLVRLGRLDEAVASYQRAVALEPDHPKTQYNLGKALHLQNRLEEAARSYRRALAIKPNDTAAHNNLGVALQAQGRFTDALRSYRRALQLEPDYTEAHSNLGNLLNDMGRFQDAVAAYQTAIGLAPDYAPAHNGLGNARFAESRLEEAAASYRRAIELKPDLWAAHSNLGMVLRLQSRPEEAAASCARAVALQPSSGLAHYNLALALIAQEKLSEALTSLSRAMALEHTDALGTWFELVQRMCDWSGYQENEARVRGALVKEPSPGAAFVMLSLSSTPEEQFACARRVAAKFVVPGAAKLPRLRPRIGERIRLGYLSADFRGHPVTQLVAGLIERHDRQRFEVVGYSSGPDDHSEIRARIAGAFDRFLDIRQMSHRQAASLIHGDAVDILIDLMGYTGNCRPTVLACRPAPIQVNYLGYPGTMGADFIDYSIADPFVVPMDQQPFFSERLVHMPDCFLCNDDCREIAARTPSRAECGLPEDGFVFCSFNNAYKMTPTFFDIWMQLLQAVPGSVLWLPETNPWAKANLVHEAATRGVVSERLVFAPWLASPRDHLARLRCADLFLDTLPYNAHTTASDALWAGLPVLTCAGNTFAGRVASSLLRAIGLDELITTSLAEYQALALRLARERELLARLRARLAQNRGTHPLFDTGRFTRNLEAAYTQMWEIWRAGRSPVAFSVPPLANAAA